MGKMIRKNKILKTIKGRIFKAEKSCWWVAESETLDVFTQGKSRKDAMSMLKDAIELLADDYKLNLSVHIIAGEGSVVYIGTDDTKTLLTLLAYRQRQIKKLRGKAILVRLENKRYKSIASHAKKFGLSVEQYFLAAENHFTSDVLSKPLEVFQGKLIAEEASALAKKLTRKYTKKNQRF